MRSESSSVLFIYNLNNQITHATYNSDNFTNVTGLPPYRIRTIVCQKPNCTELILCRNLCSTLKTTILSIELIRTGS